jgi:hypothetical protein
VDDGGEPLPHFAGDRGELGVVGDGEHSLGVDGGDVGVAVATVDGDVAGEQGAELGFGLEGLVGERRVARAEDEVGLAVDAELLFHGGLDVDLAEDAESFGLELGADASAASCMSWSVVAFSV